jgi:hypothetical protein
VRLFLAEELTGGGNRLFDDLLQVELAAVPVSPARLDLRQIERLVDQRVNVRPR